MYTTFNRLCFSFIATSMLSVLISQVNAQSITYEQLYTFDGDNTFDSFLNNLSVGGAGDVNNDGFADLIVGSPSSSKPGESFNMIEGRAQVFSGANGNLLYDFTGDNAFDLLGTSVSAAGDVNNDGFADIIVGAPNEAGIEPSARVLSGSDGQELYNFIGTDGSTFGVSVSGAGDVNNDGFADLIVGDPFGNDGSLAGNAQVFSGQNGNVLYTFNNNEANAFFGVSVSGVGDVNGDGHADLFVGASETFGPGAGSAQVLSGEDGSVLYEIDGDELDSNFGFSVSGAGDVNGDGISDLIVGAPVLVSGIFGGAVSGSGNAQVFSGSDGSILLELDGDESGASFGQSVSEAGDVNSDGFADLLIGAPGDNGGIGSAQVRSGLDGGVLFSFDGDNLGDNFGVAVSSAGDVNKDGILDFIIGASSGGANDGGFARVFVSQRTSVPEPSSGGLLSILGLTTLCRRVRRTA